MKKRVLLAGLFHETHTFLEGFTGLSSFFVARGEEMLRARGDSSPLGGVLECAEAYGWEVLPVVDYRAQPSATVADEVVEHFWLDFVRFSKEHLEQPIDAIYLVLHGAMTSVSLEDVEGELLARIRELPGLATVPLFGVFDLHANLTPRMAQLSTCLVGYRENPHTDAREAACMAARGLKRCLDSGVVPKQLFLATDLVWPPTGTATAQEPMRTLESMAREWEGKSGFWSVNVAAGFAFADTFHTGVSFLAAGEDEAALRTCLLALKREAEAHKEAGNVTDPPVEVIMERLRDAGPGLTVLVEPSDNIGGGAPGDGTGLLRALIAHGVSRAAVCLADAASVQAAEKAGVGSTVTLAIGGKGSQLDEGPFFTEVEVMGLSDGLFELEDKQSHLASMCGDCFDMGRCAVVRCQGVTVLLTSIKTPPFDLGQWRSQGVEPTDYAVIGVKAAVAHRRAYDPIAARMWWVDTPGPCGSQLRHFPFRKIRRPVFPLDS